MLKKELVQTVSQEAGVAQKVTRKVIDTVVQVIQDALMAGDDVRFGTLGHFHTAVTKAHTGRNPGTGKKLELPDITRLVFKPAITIKNLLN